MMPIASDSRRAEGNCESVTLAVAGLSGVGGTLPWVPLPPPDAQLTAPVTPPRPRDLEPGHRVGGWVVTRPLARGGMGSVVVARHEVTGETAALKVAHRDDELASRRLEREADVLDRIDSPHVVSVLDAGRAADGRGFLAMELIEGSTLARFNGSRAAVRRVLADVVEGLSAAHAKGVLHRDVKPTNVVVGPGGRAKVIDFGLAVQDAEPPDAAPSCGPAPSGESRLTETGTTMGTPAYMAPEQHLGTRLDARTDQFAFAALAFECLYGVRPFAGPTLERYMAQKLAHWTRRPPCGSATPRQHHALLRGLAPDPARRFDGLPRLLSRL